MDEYKLEEAKESLGQFIELAVQEKKPCRILSETGNAVLLSEETYDNLLITLELLSTPGLIDGMKKLQTDEDCFDDLSTFSQN